MSAELKIEDYPDPIFELMIPHLLQFEMQQCIKSSNGESFHTDAFMSLVKEMWRRISLQKPTPARLYAEYNNMFAILIDTVWKWNLIPIFTKQTARFLDWATMEIHTPISNIIEANCPESQGQDEIGFSLDGAISVVRHRLGNAMCALPTN